MNKPQVIIIGGGVVGSSVAYHLAKMGCKEVVVLARFKAGAYSKEECFI